MRWLVVSSIILLTIAALCFAMTTYVITDFNWRPVEMPIPGAGRTIVAPFEITTGGRFMLEAAVPSAEKEPDAAWPEKLNCNFELRIHNRYAFQLTKQIRSLSHSGSAGVQYYTAEDIALPRGEDYQLELKSTGPNPFFAERGGMITLTRFERTTETFLLGGLLRSGGWTSLVIGLALAIAAAFTRQIR